MLPSLKTDRRPRPTSVPESEWVGATDVNGIIGHVTGWLNVLSYIPQAYWAGIAARTDVHDLTNYLQAAIDAAIIAGTELFFPTGTYNYSTLGVTLSGSLRTLRCRGTSSGDPSATRGSILKSSANGADSFTVSGNSGNANVVFEGLTFQGTSTANNGVVVSEGWSIVFRHCVFAGYSKAGAAATKLTMSVGSFTGLVSFHHCEWESNAIGVWELPTSTNQINVVRYQDCRWLDSTEAAIKIGDTGLLMQGRMHNVIGCDFEGNLQDIVARGYVYAFNILGCYFETAGSPTVPRIDMDAGAEALVIQGNYFQHALPNDGNSIIALGNVDNAIIRSNFSSFGGSAARYFLTATTATNVRAEPPSTAPGITPYPIRISVGAVGDAVAYTSPVEFHETGSITWGTGAPAAAGRVGDMYIRTDSVGSRGAIWVKRTSNWRQIQNNDYSVLVASGGYITPNAALADVAVWTAPGGGDYTFVDPTNPSEAQTLTIRVVNNTGGALGTIAWAGGTAGYHLAGAWVNPATGCNRSITFMYSGATGAWLEVSRSAADVPN